MNSNVWRYRLHFFAEEPGKVLAWVCMVPMTVEELKQAVGVQNVDKSSVPVLAFNLKDPAGEKLKVHITPTEENKGFGLHVIINSRFITSRDVKNLWL